MNLALRLLLLLMAAAAPATLAATVLRDAYRQAVLGPLPRLGLAAATWCVATVLAAVWVPALLMGMAAPGLALGLFMLRGRMAGWRVRGPMAPGTLSFTAGVRALGDRHYYLTQFAQHGPVFRMSQFGAPTLCVLGLDRRQQLMRDHGSKLGPTPLPFATSVLRGFLRYMDEPTHNRYGTVMRRAMIGESPAHLQSDVRTLFRAMLSAQVAEGPSVPTGALTRVTRHALDALLFGLHSGLPATDAETQRYSRLATAFYGVGTGKRLGAQEEAMLAELVELLTTQEARLQGTDQAPLVPLGRLRALDASLPDLTCLQNFVFMHRIATNNVSSLLAWLLVYWASQPNEVQRIRNAPPEERALLQQRFLAETLRLSQSEYTYRSVRETFEHDNVTYPAGWLVRFCVWESHRSTTPLEAPTAFHLRTGLSDYEKAHFAPFGTGRHACTGADLNETICLALLELLTTEFDITVAGVEPVQRAGRHWGHWQPNRAMTLTVRARS
jgi:cytochrome P450